jgi:hypothetical protein
VKDQLERRAAEYRETPSAVAIRLIEEGLRRLDHPMITFHDRPAHGRVASLVGGPDVGEVINTLTGLEAQGDARVPETAEWFGIHEAAVRAAVTYYTTFRDDIDVEIDQRKREADALRRQHDADRAVLE